MSTGNKRITQLVELTTDQVVSDDLFLIIDISAKESKKIKASSISSWLTNSGSIYAYKAITADTASYILGGGVKGTVESSSFSNKSLSSVSSSWASSSISSSFASTSSYAMSAAGFTATSSSWSSASISSSFASTSNTSIVSSTTQFLQYYGGNNGTSSYAITADTANHVINADTASYVDITIVKVASSSYSDYAVSSGNSSNSNTSDYLTYSGGDNGTASYAMSSGGSGNSLNNYGMFLAMTQSISQSLLNSVDILWSAGDAQTIVDVMGTVNVNYTSSTPTNEQLNLVIKDRTTGIETIIDSSPINTNIGGSEESGSYSVPFSLMGQDYLYGSYMIYITASSNISIEPNRTARFNISSKSDNVNVYPSELLRFNYTTNTTDISFVSSSGGPNTGNINDILSAGLDTILELTMSNSSSITSVRYLWTLPNLTAFVDTINNLTSLGGMPDGLTYLDCNQGTISSINDMSNITSMSYFDCSNNNISVLPSLPQTLSYFDCSSNPISSLPTIIPCGLNVINCNDTQLTTVSLLSVDTLSSMSFNDNSSLSSVGLPTTNLNYISCNNSSVSVVSTIPTTTTQLFFQSCSFGSAGIESICSTLVSNGQSNGTLDIRGSGIPQGTAINDILTLISSGWTVLNDA